MNFPAREGNIYVYNGGLLVQEYKNVTSISHYYQSRVVSFYYKGKMYTCTGDVIVENKLRDDIECCPTCGRLQNTIGWEK